MKYVCSMSNLVSHFVVYSSIAPYAQCLTFVSHFGVNGSRADEVVAYVYVIVNRSEERRVGKEC